MATAFILSLVVLLSALNCIYTMDVDFVDCGSKTGKATKVAISPCKVKPCTLVRGTNVTIDVTFTTDQTATDVDVSLVGLIFGAKIPFPVPHPKACSYPESQLKCPLKPGQTLNFDLMMSVKKNYPKLKLQALLSLTDQSKNVIICVQMPLQIV